MSGSEDRDRPEIAGVYYTDDLINGSFGFEEGRVMAPAGPGLGVDVDADKVEKYSVTEAVSLDLGGSG